MPALCQPDIRTVVYWGRSVYTGKFFFIPVIKLPSPKGSKCDLIIIQVYKNRFYKLKLLSKSDDCDFIHYPLFWHYQFCNIVIAIFMVFLLTLMNFYVHFISSSSSRRKRKRICLLPRGITRKIRLGDVRHLLDKC